MGWHHENLDREEMIDIFPAPLPFFLLLLPPPSSSSQVKSESLGIPQKLQLKVDVESGKLIIKKSKDGSEDKFYSHKKSKAPLPVTLPFC